MPSMVKLQSKNIIMIGISIESTYVVIIFYDVIITQSFDTKLLPMKKPE